jgi:hypothetical protein
MQISLFDCKNFPSSFVYYNDLNETAKHIVPKRTCCTEFMSFGSGNQAFENIRIIEPCELLAIDRQN